MLANRIRSCTTIMAAPGLPMLLALLLISCVGGSEVGLIDGAITDGDELTDGDEEPGDGDIGGIDGDIDGDEDCYAARLSVAPAELNFECPVPGEAQRQAVTIANNGCEQMVIARLEFTPETHPGFSMTSQPILPMYLDPGDERELTIKLLAALPGEASGALRFEANDPELDNWTRFVHLNSPQAGCGIGQISVDPLAIDFGQVAIGGERSKDIIIRNTSDTYWLPVGTIDLESSEDSNFSIQLRDFEETAFPPKGGITFTVHYKPQAVGTHTNEIIINHQSEPDPENPDAAPEPVRVALSGKSIAPTIKVVPDPVDFGEVEIGETSSMQVTLSYEDGGILDVDRHHWQPPGHGAFDIDWIDLHGSSTSHSFGLEFSPDDAKEFTAVLSIIINDSMNTVFNLPMRGVGIGDPPCLEVDPRRINFSKIQIGHTSSKEVELINGCENDVQLCGITWADEEQQAFSIIDPAAVGMSAIPPNSSVSFTVEFSTLDVGDYSGTLDICSNDPYEPMIQVPVSGESAQSLLLTSPEELEFGDVPKDTETCREFVIHKVGGYAIQISGLDLTYDNPTPDDPQPSPFYFDPLLENLQLPIILNSDNLSIALDACYRPEYLDPENPVYEDSGTLQIMTDNPARPQVDIPLSGHPVASE